MIVKTVKINEQIERRITVATTREEKLMHLCEAVKAQTEEDILAQSIMLHMVYAAYEQGRLDEKTEKSA